MQKQSRGDFIKTAAVVAGGFLIPGALTAIDTGARPTLPLKELSIKPLPFDPKKLIGLSEKLIVSHWENNYAGSLKTLNAVSKRLAEILAQLDTPPFLYGDLKREQLLRTGSVILHELYFENLGGNGKATDTIRTNLAKDFGNYENWLAEFKKIANSLGGGSGWVILSYNTHFHKMENHGLADHLQNPPASIPLLVLDMFEHSYQMDYGAAASKYIEAFFANINWSVVQKRLEKVKSAY